MTVRRTAALALLIACALARAEPPAAGAPGKYEEAQAALAAGDLARAEKLMSEGIEADPNDARAWHGRAVVRTKLQRVDGALSDVERAIALRDDAAYRYLAAQLELGRKRYGPALDHARRCVALDPAKARPWALLADLEMLAGNESGGLRAINEAMRIDPKDDFVTQRGDLIFSFLTEKYPGLKAALAVGQRPGDALDHHARGAELASAERWKEAIAEWEAALRIDPTFADCHYNLGLAADRGFGDLERAEKEYGLALAGYRPEEKLLRADALNNLVYVRVRRGTAGPEDVARVREAIALDRDRPSKLDTLARACEAIGDRACARDAYAKVAASREQVPDDLRRHAQEKVEALGGAAASTGAPASSATAAPVPTSTAPTSSAPAGPPATPAPAR